VRNQAITAPPKIDFYFDEHECALMNIQWWISETFDTMAAAELLGDLKDTLRSFRKLKRTYKNGKEKGRLNSQVAPRCLGKAVRISERTRCASPRPSTKQE
jgi:hypothetical protein